MSVAVCDFRARIESQSRHVDGHFTHVQLDDFSIKPQRSNVQAKFNVQLQAPNQRLYASRSKRPIAEVTRPIQNALKSPPFTLNHHPRRSFVMAETRLAFKAGRAFRRGSTNFVDPDPTKGAILLQNGEDGLLHFIWKNRSNNEVEEVRPDEVCVSAVAC